MGSSTTPNLDSKKSIGLIDRLFPTYCAFCSTKTPLRFLCEICWQESLLINPSHRCRCCFRAIDAPSFCQKCARIKSPFETAYLFEKEAPILSILYREESIEAFAGFIVYQLLSLNWALPTMIGSLPNKKNPVASCVAQMLLVPNYCLFKRKVWPLGHERFEVKEDLIQEDSIVLILDFKSTYRQKKEAKRALARALPKLGYFLSITSCE